MVPFESLGIVSYVFVIATMLNSLALCEILSVKEWRDRDFENWVGDCSRSLKMAPFDIHTTFCWSTIVSRPIALSCISSDIELGRKS